MDQYPLRFVRRLYRDEQASFVLESSLVMPAVMIIVVGILFAALAGFDKSGLHHAALKTAQQASFSWNQPNFDGANAGLYRRITSDGFSGFLQLFGSGSPVRLQIPAAQATSGASGPAAKLSKAAANLPGSVTGTISYELGFFSRAVSLKLQKTVGLPDASMQWFRSGMANAEAVSTIIDPAELIRDIDLVRTYIPVIKDLISPEDARNALQEPEEGQPNPPVIRSEAEAREYLKLIVGGRTVNFDTDSVGEWRRIDALDRDGIAHEAKYTVNERDAEKEILKDVELIRKGLIKGSVWHFFTDARSGKTHLSDRLRLKLDEHGIVAIVHQANGGIAN